MNLIASRTAAGSIHGADLHDLVVPRRRLDHLAPSHTVCDEGFSDVRLVPAAAPRWWRAHASVGRRDDDGVDVLVASTRRDPGKARPEGLDVLQTRVVDPLGRQVRVDVAEGLDLDVLELAKPRLSEFPDRGCRCSR